ncbi:MAG: zinc transport system substrate-binding protein [Verrucomicrobiales bacterium]|jgi:zinc transport system substrate-binding protein
MKMRSLKYIPSPSGPDRSPKHSGLPPCALLAMALLFTGCGREAEIAPAPPPPEVSKREKPLIVASFYPLAYIAERMTGELAEVRNPLPADADAATWMPGDEAILAMQQADLILINGAAFESWPAKVNLPASRIVDTTAILRSELIEYEHAVKHSHGPSGDHAHEGLDGHTWLDPVNLKIQARIVQQAILKRLPEHESQINEQFKELIDDLDGLHRSLNALSGELPMLAAHPAYNYLAKRYAWNLLNLDLDPAVVPDATALLNVKHLLGNHPASTILWETEPLPEIQALLKQRFGLVSVVFSPCEHAPDSDYLAVMTANIEAIQGRLK